MCFNCSNNSQLAWWFPSSGHLVMCQDSLISTTGVGATGTQRAELSSVVKHFPVHRILHNKGTVTCLPLHSPPQELSGLRSSNVEKF